MKTVKIDGMKDLVRFILGIGGKKVGHRDYTWKAIFLDSYGCHEIQTEQGQVGQIVSGQGLVLEVGV